MDKNNKKSGLLGHNPMRRLAGIFYIVLFAAELYFFRPLYSNSSVEYVPVFVNLLLVAGLAVMAVWMLGGDALLKRSAGRAVAVGTGLVIVKSLVLYEIENELLTYSVATLLPGIGESNIWNYVFIIARMMLMIVAAFFVLGGCESAAVPGDAGEAAEDWVDEEVDGEADVIAEEDIFEDDGTEKEDRLEKIESEMDKTLPGNDR